jgi:hypothetical protein
MRICAIVTGHFKRDHPRSKFGRSKSPTPRTAVNGHYRLIVSSAFVSE